MNTMTRKAIIKEVIKVAVIGAALAGNIASARADQIKAPQEAAMKVMDVTLAIKSPKTNLCPETGKLKAWVKTNKAGPVDYFFAREGQGPGALKTANAVKTTNGYVLTIAQDLGIHQAIDTKYRLFAKGANGEYQKSMWVPLKATCKIGLGDGIKAFSQ
ncbi:hypothetical protein [Lentilitoribacter sp. EG35]|uniref:hypothetical protein n=1 Tax=Lentilitoribacter sp. EG35 TaxID=3234192 RepID=UPI0034610910